MPRADIPITVAGDVVRVRTREAAIATVIRITAKVPRPQSQPTFTYKIQLTKSQRSRCALHPLPVSATGQSKAASRYPDHGGRGRCSRTHTRGRKCHREPQHRQSATPATQ